MHRHVRSAVIAWWASGLFLLASRGSIHVLAQPADAPRLAAAPSAVGKQIVATGRGRQPWRSANKAQAKLLAKRAAMIEAYKNMAGMLGMSDSRLSEGTGTEHVDGFIRGARLKEARYYANGDVEVDIEIEAPAGSARERSSESSSQKAQVKDAELLFVEKGGGSISESEWRALLGNTDSPGN